MNPYLKALAIIGTPILIIGLSAAFSVPKVQAAKSDEKADVRRDNKERLEDLTFCAKQFPQPTEVLTCANVRTEQRALMRSLEGGI